MKLFFVITTGLNLISSLAAQEFAILTNPNLLETVAPHIMGGWSNPSEYWAEENKPEFHCKKLRNSLIFMYITTDEPFYESLSELEGINPRTDAFVNTRLKFSNINVSEYVPTILCNFDQNSSILIAKLKAFPYYLLIGKKRNSVHTLLAVYKYIEPCIAIQPGHVELLLSPGSLLSVPNKVDWIEYSFACAFVSWRYKKVEIRKKYFVRIGTSQTGLMHEVQCEILYFDEFSTRPYTLTKIQNFIQGGFQLDQETLVTSSQPIKDRMYENEDYEEHEETYENLQTFWCHSTYVYSTHSRTKVYFKICIQYI